MEFGYFLENLEFSIEFNYFYQKVYKKGTHPFPYLFIDFIGFYIIHYVIYEIYNNNNNEIKEKEK